MCLTCKANSVFSSRNHCGSKVTKIVVIPIDANTGDRDIQGEGREDFAKVQKAK